MTIILRVERHVSYENTHPLLFTGNENSTKRCAIIERVKEMNGELKLKWFGSSLCPALWIFYFIQETGLTHFRIQLYKSSSIFLEILPWKSLNKKKENNSTFIRLTWRNKLWIKDFFLNTIFNVTIFFIRNISLIYIQLKFLRWLNERDETFVATVFILSKSFSVVAVNGNIESSDRTNK